MRQRIGAALAALAMVALQAAPASADGPYPPGISAGTLRTAALGEGSVAAGGAQSCTVTSLGDVYCWSDGPAVIALRDAVQVDAGQEHACAVRRAGDVYCWGAGDAEPQEVPGLQGKVLVQVATGARHTCAVDDEGAAWCWGEGSAPVRVTGVGDPIVDIAAGGDDTCAVTAGGTAYCWERGSRPRPVPGIGAKVREVAVGGTQACALDFEGRTVCWGDEPADPGRTPLDRISAGGDQVCGIDRTGRGHCWGAGVELPGTLRDLDVGAGRGCAVDSRGYVSCWGAGAVPVRVEGLPRPPGAATGVRVRALDGGLRVSWRPPADSGSGPFEYFWVTTADNGSGCVLEDAAATHCEILGLRNGGEYDVAVVVATRDGLTISDYVTAVPSEVAPEPSGSAAPATAARELQPGEGGLAVTGLSPVALVSVGTMLLGGGLVALLVRKPSSPAPRRGTARPPA